MKANSLFRIPLVLALLSGAGCASMQQACEEQTCNQNGGYAQGMNDARDGKPMDSSFGYACPSPARPIGTATATA